jgi:hypothetical protein
MRLTFSNNVLALAGTNNFLTVRLVCNGRLGQTYIMQSWVYRAYAPLTLATHLRFFEERTDTYVDLKTSEVNPLRFYNLITGGERRRSEPTDMTVLYDKLHTLATTTSPPRSP